MGRACNSIKVQGVLMKFFFNELVQNNVNIDKECTKGSICYRTKVGRGKKRTLRGSYCNSIKVPKVLVHFYPIKKTRPTKRKCNRNLTKPIADQNVKNHTVPPALIEIW